MKTPDGETFEEFVRKALVDELKIAELYAAAAPVVLTGRLDAIAFQSGADATWRIKVTLSSSNGKSLAITEEYGCKSGAAGSQSRPTPQATTARRRVTRRRMR